MFQGEEVVSENLENSIAVFSVNPKTREPQLIQSARAISIATALLLRLLRDLIPSGAVR